MLFKPELCKAILDREKTQTRHLAQSGDGKLNLGDELWFMQGVGSNIGSMVRSLKDRTPTVVTRYRYKPYRVKWQVGRTYAIQPGRGKKAVGRFLLNGLRDERLMDITGEDALAEGFNPIQRTAPGVLLIPDLKIGKAIALKMFFKYWDSLHKPKYRTDRNPVVWVLTFELVEA